MVTGQHAADAFSADIAAEVLVRLFGRRFGTGAQNETPFAAILGVQFEHRMAGRAAAREEVEHDVAGAGGLLQKVFDQRQGLGVVEGTVAENLGDDAGAFLVGGRHEAAFRRVIADLEGRHHPAR